MKTMTFVSRYATWLPSLLLFPFCFHFTERGKKENMLKGKGRRFISVVSRRKKRPSYLYKKEKKEKETMDVGFSTDAVVPARNCASQGIVNEVGFLGRLF